MKQDKITRLLAPLVESLGYEFVGIEHMAIPKNALVRLYIDHPDGIQVEDCVSVSREVSALMDVEDPIAGNYTLEVSSPGIDRLLFCIAHFERFVGETVKLTVLPPVSGRKRFRGAIKGVKGDTVMIDQDDETIEIDHARIQKARIVPKW